MEFKTYNELGIEASCVRKISEVLTLPSCVLFEQMIFP